MTRKRITELCAENPQLVAIIAYYQADARAGEHPIIERKGRYMEIEYIPGMMQLPEVQALNGTQVWPKGMDNEGQTITW